MHELRHDPQICRSCASVDCLTKCQYMNLSTGEARNEIMRLLQAVDSRVLKDCITCYACEEYCKRGNHPFYLISEIRERRGILTAPRPITNQWINMTQMQGKPKVGVVGERVLSLCFLPQLPPMAGGVLFKDLGSSLVFGAEFMCPAVHMHFAKMSVVKERLPKVLENFSNLGVKEVICLHDECYGTYTSIAEAYGIEVPFRPIHYMDYVYEKLLKLKDGIRPLNLKAAYQRPCSSRLSPEKQGRVAEILGLIGVELLPRNYEGENSLCCGELPRIVAGFRVAWDIQRRNIRDMVQSGAEICVFNCPACQTTLGEKVRKAGLRPLHLIELCKMAVGDMGKED